MCISDFINFSLVYRNPGLTAGVFSLLESGRGDQGVGVIAENEVKIICPRCCRSTTGVIKEIEYTIKAGHYICCMHCGKRLEDPYKDIKKCMEHSSYEVRNGVVKQKR